MIDENLIEKSEQDRNANVDVSQMKLASFGACSFLSALAFGFAAKAIVAGGGLNLNNIFLIIIAHILFLTTLVLRIFFVKSQKIHNGLILVDSIALIIPFAFSLSWMILAALVFLLLGLWDANRKGLAELDNSLKIQFTRVAKRTLPSVVTVLSLFVSLAYVGASGTGASFLSRDAFHLLLSPAEPIVRAVLLPTFSIDESITQFAETLAMQQMGPTYASLPPEAKAQALDSVLNQLHGAAVKYGITFNNSDKFSQALYKYFSNQYNAIPESYKSLIPFVIFIFTFLTVRSLGGLLNGVTRLFAYVVYQFLLSVGFARIGRESMTREIIIVG